MKKDESKINILIADNSVLIRKELAELLDSNPKINVIARASNGKSAIEKIKLYGPDIALISINLPGMDGITTLKKIMKDWPLPILLLADDANKDSKRVLEALDMGAVDFMIKPKYNEFETAKNEIIARIETLSMARIFEKEINPKVKLEIKKHAFVSPISKILVIGTSTGGPQTLESLLTEFPASFPIPILIVQHMPPKFTEILAKRLNSACEIKVREAKDGDRIENGLALIAPGGFHMELTKNNLGQEVISLNTDSTEFGIRPSVNHLFNSVAPIYKENTIALVLTGMGKDGTIGSKEIKKFRGTVLAESEKSSVIYGMPKEVINAGYCDLVLDLDKMTSALVELLDV